MVGLKYASIRIVQHLSSPAPETVVVEVSSNHTHLEIPVIHLRPQTFPMHFNEGLCIPVDPTSLLVYILSNLRTGDWFRVSIDTQQSFNLPFYHFHSSSVDQENIQL